MQAQVSEELLKKYNVTADDLERATAEEKQSVDQMRPSVTYWKDAFNRFRHNKLAVVMFWILMVIILMAIFQPIFSPYSYDEMSRDVRQGPSAAHWLGTDKMGRDMLTRLMYGTRISLSVGLVTMVMVCLIGIPYGSISAYFGGRTDDIMMRIVDLFMSVPNMLVIILLSVVMRDPLKSLLASGKFVTLARLGSGLLSIYIVLALFNWLGMARNVRGALMMNRHKEFVLVSEAAGAKRKWITSKHLIPNSIGIIIINATGVVPSAIMTESFLSFIGLGVSAPVPSLGSMANDALNGIVSFPQNMLYPAVMISLIILCFNVLGDALRDALDPQMRR